MKIFCPYTNLNPATEVNLSTYEVTFIEMDGGEAYVHYWQQRWREGETFINCEHDVAFWNGAMESLVNCDKDWCSFGLSKDATRFWNAAAPTFNLVKFTDRFMERYPKVWDDFLEAPPDPEGKPKWQYCDSWLNNWLGTELGRKECHQHCPGVANANPISKSVTVQL
jgi:hypothetical protein